MELILFVIAAVLVIWGIAMAIGGRVLPGIAMVVLGLLVGPGGVSILS